MTKGIDPKRMPPTTGSAAYHSLRVYHQVQEWLRGSIDPLKYGWEIVDGTLHPKTTDCDIAPASALSVLKCSCKTDCSRARCTCNKFQILCTQYCACLEESCIYKRQYPDDDDDEDIIDGVNSEIDDDV